MKRGTIIVLMAYCVSLNGCGAYVPLKDPLHENNIDPNGLSYEGKMEANIVGNIRCEIQNAIFAADGLGSVPYLGKTWGTQVTLKLTWDELSGLSPGAAYIVPMAAMQSFALSAGVTATAHSTRVETVTFLFENRQLLATARQNGIQDCSKREKGFQVESDLRIGEFVYDKATLADTKVATTVSLANLSFRHSKRI